MQNTSALNHVNNTNAIAPALETSSTTPTTITLVGTLRDFNDSHPDFESQGGTDRGIVQTILGSDDKPIYAGGQAEPPTTHGQANFDQWYRDVPGVNQGLEFAITLDNTITSDPNVFTFVDRAFFPIDDQIFGNQGRSHNYHFTYELHSQFVYQGGEEFTFSGDDDLWVFINDQLVIDLGGVHPEETASVQLDTVASSIGLTSGNTYDFDLFFAERHTRGSRFRMDTSIALFSAPEATDDFFTTLVGEPLLIGENILLFNDQNASSVQSITDINPFNGTLTNNGNGIYTYIPDPGFKGIDTFQYTIDDGKGNQDTAEIHINVVDVNGCTCTNDPPEITLGETDGNTSVVERGSSDTYTLVLDSQPTADVTITLAHDNQQIELGQETITFTPDNWNISQTINITAVTDKLLEGEHISPIQHVISSADPAYDGMTVPNVDVAIADSYNVMFVSGDRNATRIDKRLIQELENTPLGNSEGVQIQTVDDDQVRGLDINLINQQDLIIISESVVSTKVLDTFTDVQAGVMTWESHLYDDLGMTGPVGVSSSNEIHPGQNINYGFARNEKEMTIINAQHELAGSLDGPVEVYNRNSRISWGQVNDVATVVAALPNDADKATIFAYEPGSMMAGDVQANGKRLGFFLHNHEENPNYLTTNAIELFNAAVDYMVS